MLSDPTRELAWVLSFRQMLVSCMLSIPGPPGSEDRRGITTSSTDGDPSTLTSVVLKEAAVEKAVACFSLIRISFYYD